MLDSVVPASTKVLNISDTIGFFTHVDESQSARAMSVHALLCAEALARGFSSGLPLRGATSVGDFQIDHEASIFCGAAVDEAVAWHEQADWIGVSMTPTARYSLERDDLPGWRLFNVPWKDNRKWDTMAVDWTLSVPDFARCVREMSPIVPGVVSKFDATARFMRETRPTSVA